MPISMSGMNELLKDHYSDPLIKMLEMSNTERRIYWELNYGAPNPMPVFVFWPWINKAVANWREVQYRWNGVKLAVTGKLDLRDYEIDEDY